VFFIFTAHADEQKYQNLYQLFSWTIIVCMVKLFHLQTNCKATAIRGLMVANSSIISILQNKLPHWCDFSYYRQLGAGSMEVDDICENILSY
jgi:hypothetical protein